MDRTLEALADAVAALEAVTAAWPAAGVEGMPGPQLADLAAAAGRVGRLVDAVQAEVASEVQRQSRPELGADSLAKKHGYRNAATLLAATFGTTLGEAHRLVQVGVATAPRMALTGESLQALYPHVGEALREGRIGTAAAAAIIRMLDDIAPRVHPDELDEAELALARRAATATLDDLRQFIVRVEAHLDPDGVEPKEEELRAQAGVSIRQDRTGMVVLTAKLDPERGAPVMAVIEAMVTQELNAQRDAGAGRPGTAERPITQMQVDALVTVFEHFTGCKSTDTPLPGATVIIRVAEADLQAGTGFGTIDGIDQPISIPTVRRMAGGGALVGWIMSGGSEVLHWGRRKRLFTGAQRQALVERDGGCVGCGAPPGRCKVHHIAWWSRGGPTDLNNGVLLCSSCHHRIHDQGWDIRVTGAGTRAQVWLIPPGDVDPARTPRPAATRRFDLLPA